MVELKLVDEEHTHAVGKTFKSLESMEMKEDRMKRFIKEIEIVVGLRHEHVVSYIGVCFLPDNLLPVLVMEQLMSSLYAYFKHIANCVTPENKKRILADVASGLDYLHNHKPAIIHCDLTPRNVLLQSGDLKAKISDCCDARILSLGTHQVAEDPTVDIKFFGLLAIFTILEREVHPPKPERVFYRLRSEYEDQLLKEATNVLPSHSPLLELIRQCLGPADERPRAAVLREKLRHIQAAPSGIRASVDALCRDGTSEISRDPRTKRLQTRRESLARPSKHTNNNLLDSYLAVHKPSSFLPASSLPRENPLTRDFHNFLSSYSSSSSSLSSSSSSSVNPLSPY